MSFSSFLRDGVQAYADNVVASLLILGGSLAIGALIDHYGRSFGLDGNRVRVLAGVGVLILTLALSLLLKPKHKSRRDALQQTLTQKAIVSAPTLDFKPHNEFKPSVVVNVAGSESRTRAPGLDYSETQGEFREPNLEFVNHLIIECRLDAERGLVDEEDADSESPAVKEALARFYYKPDQGVPARISVKAHASIADSEGVPLKTRFDTVWQDYEYEYQEFYTADTHELVIAVILDGAIAVLQYDTKPYADTQYGRYFSPTPEVLEGTKFRLRIELIGKSHNAVVTSKRFEFTLALEPLSFELT